MHAGLDTAQVGQGGDQADGAVAAHAQVPGIVEEDHAGGVCRVLRRAKQGAHHDVAAAGLQDGCRAPCVVFVGQAALPFGHVARAQIGKAGDDKPGGFTAGMGVDDTDLIH
ncbi:hypothetical protein D3C87_1708150 [compost metagenome]